MRPILTALSCLAALVASHAFASGQDRLADPKAAVEQAFWQQLYADGGVTLYCGKTFSAPGGLLSASPVYSAKQIKSALRCVTDSQCQAANAQYPYMLSDLHNLYPDQSRIELARRNALFGDVGDGGQRTLADCDFKSAYQLVEPRDAAKGNVARAIFYMHSEYGLPIVGQLQMFQQWNRLDPVDDEERARNSRIEAIQGNRNRFIDDPSLADSLQP
ncbi:endonuclease [Pseudomonas sp. JS3066]|uniref:endonuclease I family protein n=1 Tax=Pseudomonas sp. JS3066 TaxID=3090665 RepID=UPI002E7B52BE|nr:endonuclease [Pseudomonas sp. JS3066]WVK93565.1 endonuclease [Pseudomonas sp. JS3066]